MDEFLWVEKYRPQNLDACVLPTNLKNTLKEFVANGSGAVSVLKPLSNTALWEYQVVCIRT